MQGFNLVKVGYTYLAIGMKQSKCMHTRTLQMYYDKTCNLKYNYTSHRNTFHCKIGSSNMTKDMKSNTFVQVLYYIDSNIVDKENR